MAGRSWRAPRGLTWLALALLLSTFLAPTAALADTNLEIGGTAVIAYANGDNVRLRESPGLDGKVIQTVREGATVDVVDGPVQDADGNNWYQVTFDGQTGYIISDYLALSSGPDASSPDLPFNPASDAIGAAMISGTNNDGVRCRADADPGAAVITVVPEGTIVDITGAAVDGWQPINCAGQSGFVSTDYVDYDVSGDSSGVGSDAQVESASVAGTAIVSGTNGDGVRCRAGASLDSDIITVLSEGSTVTLRDVVKGDFQGVVCAGENGYAASEFLSTDGSASDGSDTSSAAVIGTATVSGTNGDGVRCRTDASLDASVIVVLPEGTDVSLRDATSGNWQGVVCGGENGFVFADFLSTGGGSSDGGSGGSGDVTGSGVVSGTNGDGVRCRTSESFDSSVITVLSEGAGVDLRGDQDGDWMPVVCDGQNGWVFAEFVSVGGAGGGSDGGGGDAPSNSDFSSGDVAVVSGTGGAGVRLRASASLNGDTIMVVNEGKSVDVIDGSTGDWVAVSVGGTSGFINMNYLAAAASQDSTGDAGGGSGLSSGDHAMTLANLNLRFDPSLSGGVAAVAPEGTVVQITGKISNNFYPVDWDGVDGYMSADYLSATDEPLSSNSGSMDGGSSDSGGGGPTVGSSSGSAIVDFAMQYLGYPYVWATHGPSTFDCSGFTYWVVLNTLGEDIGASTSSQIDFGTPVSESDLQPGDLVFFQNTYTWGLSHVGIYIGNGQFIHAENESTGVVISNLSSDYYASRWYGARRLT